MPYGKGLNITAKRVKNHYFYRLFDAIQEPYGIVRDRTGSYGSRTGSKLLKKHYFLKVFAVLKVGRPYRNRTGSYGMPMFFMRFHRIYKVSIEFPEIFMMMRTETCLS